jgi:hypothetical protein
MPDRLDLTGLTEPELELALADLARALAWPAPTGTSPALDDPATRARRRIVAEGVAPIRRTWWLRRPRRRPLRSSLLLAAAALLVLAAIAAAIGLGLPGIRITFTSSPLPSIAPAPTSSPLGARIPRPSASSSPSPSAGPLGWQLGLGAPIAVADLGAAVTFPVRLPSSLGPPASAWLLDGRVTTVWPTAPGRPPLEQHDLGLVLTELRGDVDAGYFEKILSPGTTIQPVTVEGVTGYWISGRPHELVFVDPSGEPVFDSRRIVGDTLIWARDGITYRLESGLDRDGAIKLADSLR